MGLGGLDEEKQVQKEAEETEKVVNLDEEKKRRKPFCYWTVGGKDYRLKLKAANVEKLENKYKCNIMHMIDDLPPLSVMLTIIQAAMQSWEHGVKYTDVQNLKVQSVTLNNITLNAIPVPSGGNVTIDGQQYIADCVDVERGKLVRMIGVANQDAFATSKWESTGSITIYSQLSNVGTGNAIVTISSKFTADWSAGDEIHHFTQPIGQTLVIVLPKTITTIEQGEEIRAKGFEFYYKLAIPIEIDLTEEENAALKELATYYPVTNISINSEQIDGYTIFNYPISMANGWNYVKQQLNDNRDYIYDMDSRTQDIDTQAAEAYVNSEYAVALTELEV